MSVTTDISLLTVGDISFRGRWEECPSDLPFEEIVPCFARHSLVVANLESPLVGDTSTAVTGKCTLSGDIGWAKILHSCGIDLVTLANNHVMDYGVVGLSSTMSALDDAGILHVGAGRTVSEACAPVIKNITGQKIAFLGRSAVEVSSPCFAGADHPGVARFDEHEIVDSIKKCQGVADTVVVMLHWGIEHYCYPAPKQRLLAKKLVAAGADILLGHHPHVLQGEEQIERAIIAYSSGNLLFDEFSWSIEQHDGQARVLQSTLSEKNRQGMMLELAITDKKTISTRPIFTKISPETIVQLDDSSARQNDYANLCKRLHGPFYSIRWKLYSMQREWALRFKDQLSPLLLIKKIHKIRPRHFKELVVKLRRSGRVASGKSTNPYEG